MCGAPLDDWINGGYVVLFTCHEFGFSSLGSWSYSKEWVWNLGGKKYVALLQGSEMSTG